MTVLSRLVQKSALKREKVGRSYIYFAQKHDKTGIGRALQVLKSRFFKGRSDKFVSYLLEHTEDLTKKELDQIAALIEKKKRQM